MKQLLFVAPILLIIACVKQISPTTMPSNSVETTYTPAYVSDIPKEEHQILKVAWSHLPRGDQWTRHTQEAIKVYGQGLLRSVPQDITYYCPRYAQLDLVGRGDFWVNLISKLAYFESGYDPQSSYIEQFYDNSGKRVVSRGLLQLSQESANGYGCGIADSQALHDPKVNLMCGVRIINRWITQDRIISGKKGSRWRGLARYWSPFRSPDRRNKIASYTSSLPYCH